MKKIIILVLLVSIFGFTIQCYGQDTINQRDRLGRKTGLWIEYPLKDRKVLTYYEEGVEHGLSRIYDHGYLHFMGEMCHGLRSGTWYYFERDFLDMKVENIQVLGLDAKGLIWLTGHMTWYSDSGQVEAYGDILWNSDDSPESDTSINVGEWTFVSENGEIRRKYYPEVDPSMYLPLPKETLYNQYKKAGTDEEKEEWIHG